MNSNNELLTDLKFAGTNVGMKRMVLAISLLGLPACGLTTSGAARDQLEFLQAHHASKMDICEAATKLANADRDEQNDQYESDRLGQRIDCRLAEQEAAAS